CATCVQLLQNRAAQCGTLHRIGPGAKFVHQNERPPGCLAQNLGEKLQVCTERGQTRFDALLVPYVREDVIEYRHRAEWTYRRRDPRLEHRGDEPDGLEQHGLATRVGTREEQCLLTRIHRQVEGHHVRHPCEKEWMPCAPKYHTLVCIREIHRRALEVGRITRPRVQRIQL